MKTANTNTANTNTIALAEDGDLGSLCEAFESKITAIAKAVAPTVHDVEDYVQEGYLALLSVAGEAMSAESEDDFVGTCLQAVKSTLGALSAKAKAERTFQLSNRIAVEDVEDAYIRREAAMERLALATA